MREIPPAKSCKETGSGGGGGGEKKPQNERMDRAKLLLTARGHKQQ